MDGAIARKAKYYDLHQGTVTTLTGSLAAGGKRAIAVHWDWDMALALGTYTIRYQAKCFGRQGHCRETEKEWEVCYRIVDRYDYGASQRGYPPENWFVAPFCGGFPVIWDQYFNILERLSVKEGAYPFDVFAVGCRRICTGYRQ